MQHNSTSTSISQTSVGLKLKSRLKRFAKWSFSLLACAFVLMLGVDFFVSYSVKDRVYTDIRALPYREYAVVLGTAKYYPSGQPNLYYRNRLNAAVEVFKARKADYFLLSGDNTTPYYNEPRMMLRDLKRRGIPQVMLKQDFAGYDTLSSILRADRTFKITPFTIISQQFHCERALLIAKLNDIDAICYAADHPENHYRVRLREVLARVGMVLEYLIGRTPKTFEILPERTITSKA